MKLLKSLLLHVENPLHKTKKIRSNRSREVEVRLKIREAKIKSILLQAVALSLPAPQQSKDRPHLGQRPCIKRMPSDMIRPIKDNIKEENTIMFIHLHSIFSLILLICLMMDKINE